MDSQDLNLNINFVGTSGVVLSSEQKAALQSSLVILRNENKFFKVYFWGKIIGVKEDYFIAQGVERDEFMPCRYFYSKDCIQWGLLPPATKEVRALTKIVKGRFTGDPSYEYEHTEIRKVGEGEEATEEEEVLNIKEEDRLASIISEVDSAVRIVPRSAYTKSATGQVIANRSFEGLTVAEAGKLNSYMHFREAEKLVQTSILQRANLDKSVDFMDTLENDIPRGGWSLQFERGSGLVTLRSLEWPGYTFYHIPGTSKYGSVYFGHGEKNRDLPFML